MSSNPPVPPEPTSSTPGPSLRRWRGKGRIVLTGFFFLFLTLLSIHPGHSFRPALPALVVTGWPVVTPDTVRSWVKNAPGNTFHRGDALVEWVHRYPWIKEASSKTFPWGAMTLTFHLRKPMAILKSSSAILPSGTDLPSENPLYVAYLLSNGKVLNGRVVSEVRTMPDVIVRSPLGHRGGERLVNAIRLVSRCHSSGAPAGNLFVFRQRHEIRFFPDRSSFYLVLPETAACRPFRLYSRLLSRREALPEGVIPVGYDLRFKGMILVRPNPPLPAPDKPKGKMSRDR
uniref:Uncharacterized protein n=1 Tax=Leptospirillum ferriphilum TaxID=178606 RepID=A0A7C3QZK1_9BACT